MFRICMPELYSMKKTKLYSMMLLTCRNMCLSCCCSKAETRATLFQTFEVYTDTLWGVIFIYFICLGNYLLLIECCHSRDRAI